MEILNIRQTDQPPGGEGDLVVARAVATMAKFGVEKQTDALADWLNEDEVAGVQPLAGSTSNAPRRNVKVDELVNAWRQK